MNLFVITILLIISSALSGYLVFFAFDKYLVVNEFAKFFLCLVLVVIIFYFFCFSNFAHAKSSGQAKER